MPEAVLSIKHWGNNLGVRLPQSVARAAQLHADQQVRVTVEAGRVVIEPLPTAPLSLDERLRLSQQLGGPPGIQVGQALGEQPV